MAKRKAARIDPAAAATEVEDLDGERHRLGSLWRERPVVLVFLRHFG
jgi:hypothetical protein